MKIHEYQAKELFRQFGVPVPRGRVAATAAEATVVARELGALRVVLKAQVHAGGRGKAGGIKVVEAGGGIGPIAEALIGMRLVTHQTGAEGRIVKKLLVEEAIEIAGESYLAITLDRRAKTPAIIASPAGGMDIEEVAAKTPEKILTLPLLPTLGVRPYHGVEVARFLGLSGEQAKAAGKLVQDLYRLFVEKDCALVEINPLATLRDGRLVAADAKVSFDASALARHPDVVAYRDLDEEDPYEVEASKYRLSYVHLDGNIGCMVNGAGLAMATMDIIKLAGGQPANFLDVGGGASAEQVGNAFRILLSDAAVAAVLVNIFGGIMRCDVLARGIIQAIEQVHVNVPVVVRMKGTNVDEGKRLLQESKLAFILAEDMGEAAQKVVAAAREGGRS